MVKCTVQGCKHKIKLEMDCLVDHCSTKHGWRDYPCKYDNCAWVSYSSSSYKAHVTKFHERPLKMNTEFRCNLKGCNASFYNNKGLKLHTQIHENIGYKCQFCQYKNNNWTNFDQHLKSHFENRSFKCEFCDKAFITKGNLKNHFESIHEEVMTKCPLCSKINNLRSMRAHIFNVHKVNFTSFDRTTGQFVLPS